MLWKRITALVAVPRAATFNQLTSLHGISERSGPMREGRGAVTQSVGPAIKQKNSLALT